MNENPLYSVSVAGVVFDDSGRVLLIRRRDNGDWQAPGGILEPHESFEDGVVREVLEETGVQVGVERLTGVYKNLTKGVVALVYRCRPFGGSVEATHESAAVEWVDLDDALQRMTPAFAIRVEDALRRSTEAPASRMHDGVRVI